MSKSKPPQSVTRRKWSTLYFAPLRSLTYVGDTGCVLLPPDLVKPEAVGLKAYGLSAIPESWVPRFLVISAKCFDGNGIPIANLPTFAEDAIRKCGLRGERLIVRSSGTSETIDRRGQLFSQACTLQDLAVTLQRCSGAIRRNANGTVHWIVQEHVASQRQGHLSNERRVSAEKRDWIAEIELQNALLGYSMPIAVRRWRDGDQPPGAPLKCTSELKLRGVLKQVAMWAEQLSSRMHFEWVWNGSEISIVQADVADSAQGVDPSSLLPKDVPPVSIDSLSKFKLATSENYSSYGKLRNARLYKQLGYKMPPFYVLDCPETISKILGGEIPELLNRDLTELTKRPLILRTDGPRIPANKREMLPRSDELRTPAEAKAWLLGKFRGCIEQSRLSTGSLSLIAHHFIPSIASAWALAEPGNRIVRIEGLWGIPEGLYWYSHDTYEVDTRDVALRLVDSMADLRYDVQQRLRYKGAFIAPDPNGRWVPYTTKEPFDWRASIAKRQLLFEIAYTSRRVAGSEGHAVVVMWFIGNHPKATGHAVLPWYHSRSQLTQTPKAAPRRKLAIAHDFSLNNSQDWAKLREEVISGRVIERVLVQPTDSELIRNPDFAKGLAKLAASKNIIIELAGGVLSHAYYILRSQGAQVECVDLFGANEDAVEYNKLVRDKIPKIIKKRGEKVEVVRLSGDALVAALLQKLVEESFEAFDAKSSEDLIAELADVEEVMAGLRNSLGFSEDEIKKERDKKHAQRGGFDQGYMLKRTLTPHSLQAQRDTEAGTKLELKAKPAKLISISRPEEIPTSQTYRRPDLRVVEGDVEKLLVFETEINRANVHAATDFALPNEDGTTREFTLTLELRRKGAVLRSNIRLRLRPSQLSIDFHDSQLELEFPR